MPTAGLTGNFGMGKSTVLAIFEHAGAVTFDVDDFVAEILQKKQIISSVAAVLGHDVVDISRGRRQIDRKKVAGLIFNDPAKRRQIEDIIHPKVLVMMKDAVRPHKNEIVIVEVPLLFESGFDKYFDYTITVFTDINTAIARLSSKDIAGDMARKIISAQMSITRKKSLADFRIDNSDGFARTEKGVMRVFKKISRGKI